MSEINPSDLEIYRDKLHKLKRLKAATVKRRFTNLSSVFEYAIESMKMVHLNNPVKGVKLPSAIDEDGGERDRIFEGDEETRYFSHAHKYGRCIFIDVAQFAIETTMRKAEMIGLDEIVKTNGVKIKRRRHDGIKWHMVHLNQKIIKLPASIAKTGRKRDVPLSPIAIKLLMKQMPENGKVDPMRKVFDISPDGIRNAHNRTRKAAGLIDFRFHDLRHVGITKWSKKLPLLQLMQGNRIKIKHLLTAMPPYNHYPNRP